MLLSDNIGENIRNLSISRYMRKRNHSCIKSFTSKIAVHFDMLGALIIYRVGSCVNCTDIVSMKWSRLIEEIQVQRIYLEAK